MNVGSHINWINFICVHVYTMSKQLLYIILKSNWTICLNSFRRKRVSLLVKSLIIFILCMLIYRTCLRSCHYRCKDGWVEVVVSVRPWTMTRQSLSCQISGEWLAHALWRGDDNVLFAHNDSNAIQYVSSPTNRIN